LDIGYTKPLPPAASVASLRPTFHHLPVLDDGFRNLRHHVLSSRLISQAKRWDQRQRLSPMLWIPVVSWIITSCRFFFLFIFRFYLFEQLALGLFCFIFFVYISFDSITYFEFFFNGNSCDSVCLRSFNVCVVTTSDGGG